MNFQSSSPSLGDQSITPDENIWREQPARYFDRQRAPQETVACARKYFKKLGITRIADQTNLDRIGIPCFAAFRPNALTLANNQGKGLTADMARASAVMEAVEFGIAEDLQVSLTTASTEQMQSQNKTLVDFASLLPVDADIAASKPLRWVKGYHLRTAEPCYIPSGAVDMNLNNKELPRVCKTTNGLASGNNDEEAIFHGLCELIERDAGTFWEHLSLNAKAQTAIEPEALEDEEVNNLHDRIKAAGLKLVLFEQTSDIRIPCMMALIGDPNQLKPTQLELAAGYGAHPVAARAAIRAITEAAQTRITSIAGSRDDIDPATYSQYSSPEHLDLLKITPEPQTNPFHGPSTALTPLSALRRATDDALAAAGVADVFAFPLCDDTFDLSVFKIVAPELEDFEANFHWRPKARSLNRQNPA